MADDLREAMAQVVLESWSNNNGICESEVCEAERGFTCTCAMESVDAVLALIGIPLATLERLRSGVSVEVPVTTVGAAMHLARKAGASATHASLHAVMGFARPSATEAGHE